MQDYMTMNMVEQEYVTGKKIRRLSALSFPNVPYDKVQAMPDDSNDSKNEHNTDNLLLRGAVGTDNRTVVKNPHKLGYARYNGRVESEFFQEDGNIIVKHGTGFVFANNWVMTTAFNIYDPKTDKFADRILYYPALGGNLDNLVYNPVDITRAFVHQTVISYIGTEMFPLYNIAFLKLDEIAEKPEGYCGFRYQYQSYVDEGVMLLGYPEDLPKDAQDSVKGTYMYRGMGTITRSDDSYLYHYADTSKGYEGAPMYMYWGDQNGYVTIGINAYEGTGKNIGLRINQYIFGAMKMIRNNGMQLINYSQPQKPDNSNKVNISTIFDAIRLLGEMFIEYKLKTVEIKPDMRTVIIGICNYLRHIRYDDVMWAVSLFDPIDTAFVNYVKSNNSELADELNEYIGEKSMELKDDGDGIIDFAHFAATLEGYVGLTPVSDFWTGWGADLATGMAKTSKVLIENYPQDSISKYLITKISYELIGADDSISPCNFSDFCADFDAIKVSELVTQMEREQILHSEQATGHELANILEEYYTGIYKNRFQFIFMDLQCSLSSGVQQISDAIYEKMTGADEELGLLTTFGNNPSEQVIQDCCNALANYIQQEIK
ncbi:trypsin-like serine peptidase [Anaerostipes sp.]|uniref:trypsin-like serine peptidase n=1 Tax=Anaerostipes sp. TaxID=1872530 RepID=UPI0025C16E42|nr:hypothetical protein [Anaerostipes sp.]MBS7008648.1 hypothetical protein [Anaerostipes sp.]